MTKKPYGTVLIKSAKIMDCIAFAGAPVTLKEIAEAVEMTTSTTLKILDTLVLIGYATKDESDKTYQLGPSLIKFGNTMIDNSTLKKIAVPILEELQAKVDETIHLGVANGFELVYLDKLEPKNQSIYMSSRVGVSRPLYSTGMGKIFLSSFEEEKIAQYFEMTELEAYTDKTITDQEALREEIERMKSTAIAYDDEEMEKDCYCIAMPIESETGIDGSFSVSMPKFRADDATIAEIISTMQQAKIEIETQLREK